MYRRILTLLASLFIASCFPHVQVNTTLPPTSAPLYDRVQAYQELKVVGLEDLKKKGEQRGKPFYVEDRIHAILGNGTTLYHSDDLLPLVGRVGEFGKLMQLATQQQKRSKRAFIGGLSLLGSAGLLIPVAFQAGDRGNQRNANIAGSAGAVSIITGTALLLVSLYFRVDSQVQKYYAWEEYDGALRHRLGLCAQGLVVNVCDSKGAPIMPASQPQSAASMPTAP